MTSRKPNVLYVFSDQQRASAIGCAQGDEDLETPNFDALAGEGMRLESAVSNSPVCTPYRAMLMTGLYGHHTGVTTNNCYPDLSRHPHIGRTFSDAGYRCGYIGKWHLGEEVRLDAGHAMRLGFDDEWFVPLKGRHNNPNREHAINSRETEVGEGLDRTEAETNRAIEFINRQDGDKPWCLFVSWYPPHPPLEAPDRYVGPYLGQRPAETPHHMEDSYTKSEFAALERQLCALLRPDCTARCRNRSADGCIDRECGQAENTIMSSSRPTTVKCSAARACIQNTGHTESRPKFLSWFAGQRKIEAGCTLGMPFGTPDIFPTLCGLAGIDVPEGLDGVDCCRAFLGGQPPREAVYLTMQHGYVPWPGWRGLRTQRYNYARTESGPWILFDLDRRSIRGAQSGRPGRQARRRIRRVAARNHVRMRRLLARDQPAARRLGSLAGKSATLGWTRCPQ